MKTPSDTKLYEIADDLVKYALSKSNAANAYRPYYKPGELVEKKLEKFPEIKFLKSKHFYTLFCKLICGIKK